MRVRTFAKKCMIKFIAVLLTILNVILLITRVFGSTDLFQGEDSGGYLAKGGITKITHNISSSVSGGGSSTTAGSAAASSA
jgi:hypothetical protein